MKKLLTFLALGFLLILALPTPALAHGGMEGIILLPLAGIWIIAILVSIAMLVVCCKMSSMVTICLMAVINIVFLGIMWYCYYVSALSYTFAIRRGIHPSHLFGQNFMMFAAMSIGFLLLLNILIAAFKMGRYKYATLGVLLGMFVVAFLLTVPKLKKERSITALIDNINKRPVPFGRTDLPQGEQDFSRLKEMEPDIKKYAFRKAAGEGNIAVIKILLDEMSPEEINSAFYRAMNNPHYDACNTDENAFEIMTLLLENGADVNYEEEYSVSGETYTTTPLTRAAECCELSLVNFLLDHGANVNQTSKHGRDYNETALSIAYELNNKEITKLLLKHGADINIPGSNWGTILGYAVRYKDMAEIQWVLDQKIDVNVPASGGGTPLHAAAYEGKDDIVKLLISHGANVNAVTTRFNHAPLFEAVYREHLSTVKILLEHGADPNIPSRDVYEGKTVLDLAPTQEIKDLLHQYGAKTSEELKQESETPLTGNKQTQSTRPTQQATRQETTKQQDTVSLSTEELNTPDQFGETPLLKAVKKGQTEEVNNLIAQGADVNFVNPFKESVLMVAVKKNQPEIVKLLINARADINYKDNFGKSILQVAEQKGFTEIAELLRSAGAKE